MVRIASQKIKKFKYENFLAAISYSELDENWNKSGPKTWPLYLASYCSSEEFKKKTKEEWKEEMIQAALELNLLSGISRIDKENLINFSISFAEYAQPIISPGFDLFPNPETADDCYFANMHNIYPNDRGQNRAFLIGEKRAFEINTNLNNLKKYMKNSSIIKNFYYLQ